MDSETIAELNRRMLHNMQHNTTDLAAGEARVPAKAFLCPQHLAREKNALFRHTPQPVAFSTELPQPESVLALQVVDIPVLLTRCVKGKLRAFINSCSHRGSQLSIGPAPTRGLVCPFHGWAYDLKGHLRGRPEDTCFDTPAEDCSLQPLPVSERCGIIVLGLDSSLPQDTVDNATVEIEGQLEGFNLESYQFLARRERNVAANWKLLNDLSLESYHFNTLHRDSVGQLLAPNAVIDTYNRHSRWAFPLQSLSQLFDKDEADFPASLQGSCTFTIYPGVMFIFNALGAQMIRAEPGAIPGQSRVVYAGVAQQDCELEQARQAYEFGGTVFFEEDLPVAEKCQIGLAASERDLLLGRNEPLLQFWHRLWSRALHSAPPPLE